MPGSRIQSFVAEELSSLLLEIYQSKHVPQMVKDFAEAGFTKELLSKYPEKVFLMIVIAAYDRRPFTGSAGGYEYIWGMKSKERSLPSRLSSIGLSDPDQVNKISRDEIKAKLKVEKIDGCSLDQDGHVDYSKTLLDAAATYKSFHEMFTKASNHKDASKLYNEINNIHGIGEIIAAKLMKYLLREIGIGSIAPHLFPLTVVWPIIDEYHNEQARIKLHKLGSDVLPLAMGLLLQKGDPFAIDSLFYLNRYEPKRLEEFITDMGLWKSTDGSKLFASPVWTRHTKETDKEKAKLLLEVIADVCDDVKGITKEQLMGLGQPNQVQAAARRLYSNMANYASKGDVNGMYNYYQNCLKAQSGMEWDWLLEKIGRRSLKSEWARFQSVYKEENEG